MRPALPEPLRLTLESLAKPVSATRDPWWVISSAAVALYGASLNDVRDVDLLMSERDAIRALIRLGIEPRAGQASDLFQSAVFGTWFGSALPVEIFGGFEYAGPSGWTAVLPRSREPMTIGSHSVFVPSAAELRRLLINFGRPKDIARAELLL